MLFLYGLIENACIVESPVSGIKNVISESKENPIAYTINGTVKYTGNNVATVYTAEGRIVAQLSQGESIQLPTGVYIVVDNRQSLKLVLK